MFLVDERQEATVALVEFRCLGVRGIDGHSDTAKLGSTKPLSPRGRCEAAIYPARRPTLAGSALGAAVPPSCGSSLVPFVNGPDPAVT